MSLTHKDSYLNCWQPAFPDPQLRLEYEGSPVLVSTAVGADAVKWLQSIPVCKMEACQGSDGSCASWTFTLSLFDFFKKMYYLFIFIKKTFFFAAMRGSGILLIVP